MNKRQPKAVVVGDLFIVGLVAGMVWFLGHMTWFSFIPFVVMIWSFLVWVQEKFETNTREDDTEDRKDPPPNHGGGETQTGPVDSRTVPQIALAKVKARLGEKFWLPRAKRSSEELPSGSPIQGPDSPAQEHDRARPDVVSGEGAYEAPGHRPSTPKS